MEAAKDEARPLLRRTSSPTSTRLESRGQVEIFDAWRRSRTDMASSHGQTLPICACKGRGTSTSRGTGYLEPLPVWFIREGGEGSPSHPLLTLFSCPHLSSEILSFPEISSLSGDCLHHHHFRYRCLEGRTAPADVLEIRTSHRSHSEQTLIGVDRQSFSEPVSYCLC